MNTEKYIYLLTGLQQTISSLETLKNGKFRLKTKHEKRELELGRIRIKLRTVLINEKKENRNGWKIGGLGRIVFKIDDGIKNERVAQTFADAVMLGIAVAHETCLDEIPAAIAIPENILDKRGFIEYKDIPGKQDIGSEIYFKLANSIGIPKQTLDYVWHIIPALFQYEYLLSATSFFRESITKVWVADDDVFEIMCDSNDLPVSQTERAQIETAYQSAFKSIEAIIGEPSKDKRKLRQQLIGHGLNPDEIVGYELYNMKPGKEKLLHKIQVMQHNRDKKAAHGRTNIERNIGYCELKDKQSLARHVILTNIEYKLKELN
jgi:hypothetical protein